MQRSIIEILTDLQETYDFSLVFITHDLPLVKDLCDRLAVMYAFEFIETGPTRDVIGNARHPYTRALLNATPNLDTPLDEMKPIVGKSPDPVNVPPGCSYHPRCPLADDRCEEEDPKLVSVGDNHRAACFYWDDVPDQIPLSTASEEENDE
jgi:oligopeptide/dipeptide ABC transporter ATP-binding protein